MTELEQYKRAYATLVGRVDKIIGKMETITTDNKQDAVITWMSANELKKALNEAEDIFLDEDPEEA